MIKLEKLSFRAEKDVVDFLEEIKEDKNMSSFSEVLRQLIYASYKLYHYDIDILDPFTAMKIIKNSKDEKI